MLDDPDDDPELYEFLRGRWSKKETVGRADHSAIELAIAGLLHPQAAALRARVMHEWTVVQGAEKIIPDVTFSFPNPTMHEGYLVAPAFLVVECRPAGRKLKSLFDKCRLDHHRMGHSLLLDYRCAGTMRLRMPQENEWTASPGRNAVGWRRCSVVGCGDF